jgi:hypothetical protein
MDPLFRLYNNIRLEQAKIREYTPKVNTTDVGLAYSTIVANHHSNLIQLQLQATLQIQSNLSTLSTGK